MLSPSSRTTLLGIARLALDDFTAARTMNLPPLSDMPEELREPGAVFVTLRIGHVLRGCVGSLERDRPLAHEVIQTAVASASEDSRFDPLDSDELANLTIEISVLSPLRRVQSDQEILAGVHGVMIASGHRRGLFLPQVWHESGWDKPRFLNELCESKAGLPVNAWKDPQTELFVFDVDSFEAPATGLPDPTTRTT